MGNLERIKLVAPCGIDCGTCELYMSKDNEQLYTYLISRGIPEDKIPCAGCRNIEGYCPVIGEKCETYKCVENKGVKFCYECDDFPCLKLLPSADRADVLPHNTKMFNLCTIKKIGKEKFVKESLHIKNLYYKGKIEIGKGPRENLEE